MSAKPPDYQPQPPLWAPSPTPTLPPTPSSSPSLTLHQSQPSKSPPPIDFSPPLIAMVVVAAAAFLLVTYSRAISRHVFPPFHRIIRKYRQWRRRRRLRPHFPPSDTESLPPLYESSDGFFVYSPFGLDESVIKSIPLTTYNPCNKKPSPSSKLGYVEDFEDCAVCLLELEDGDYIRTLPSCDHSFHVDCIDMWLRSHATCPLCRAAVFLPPRLSDSPMTPIMAGRIRPSLDEGVLLESMFLEPLLEGPELLSGEIQPDRNDELYSPERGMIQSEDHRSNRRELDFLLKRSYSFGFERSFPSERILLEAATTPHRHHRHHNRRSFFWSKRTSSSSTPFSSMAKSRVFSFRQNRGGAVKSPSFFRRRSFFPLSESSASLRYADGSSRRLKSMTSPMFARPGMGTYSSSRMRLGDPEALISPDRYQRGG